ncbi:hypothetical protein E2562_025274 [Oryza meyeriana var. granulata]|uniref:Uncharacterized protein n=1 Tax=Oryza meyeriana var. granulata TaxID=110450 RepID=A0A6G1BNQ7_9ORYZ|nr:hypothetical protein E2562_025274 [Oryza meyeriana var. granulata]
MQGLAGSSMPGLAAPQQQVMGMNPRPPNGFLSYFNVNIGGNDEDVERTEKRLSWTQEEDLRLMFLDTQNTTKEDRTDLLETQKRVSTEKVEAKSQFVANIVKNLNDN